MHWKGQQYYDYIKNASNPTVGGFGVVPAGTYTLHIESFVSDDGSFVVGDSEPFQIVN